MAELFLTGVLNLFNTEVCVYNTRSSLVKLLDGRHFTINVAVDYVGVGFAFAK